MNDKYLFTARPELVEGRYKYIAMVRQAFDRAHAEVSP